MSRASQRRDTPVRLRERPIFQGQRLTVWAWMTRELQGMLGAGADAFGFDLDEHAIDWLEEADARAMQAGVIPDLWRWLKDETLREARCRGLTMAEPVPARIRMSSWQYACPHTPACEDRQRCAIQRFRDEDDSA